MARIFATKPQRAQRNHEEIQQRLEQISQFMRGISLKGMRSQRMEYFM
jgi:hypothetical protein